MRLRALGALGDSWVPWGLWVGCLLVVGLWGAGLWRVLGVWGPLEGFVLVLRRDVGGSWLLGRPCLVCLAGCVVFGVSFLFFASLFKERAELLRGAALRSLWGGLLGCGALRGFGDKDAVHSRCSRERIDEGVALFRQEDALVLDILEGPTVGERAALVVDLGFLVREGETHVGARP